MDTQRMLSRDEGLIGAFVAGEIGAGEFERRCPAAFETDDRQTTGPKFRLFADVDDYVGDPALRREAGGLDGEQLRARVALERLYPESGGSAG